MDRYRLGRTEPGKFATSKRFDGPRVGAGCAMCLPMAATPEASSTTRSRLTEAGPSKLSNAPTPPKASFSCHPAGRSSGPSHGSAGAGDWPRTGRKPSKAQPHGPTSPQSACLRAEPQGIATHDELLNRALTPLPSGVTLARGRQCESDWPQPFAAESCFRCWRMRVPIRAP